MHTCMNVVKYTVLQCKTPVYGCLKSVTLTLDHRNNNYSVDEKLSKLEISY